MQFVQVSGRIVNTDPKNARRAARGKRAAITYVDFELWHTGGRRLQRSRNTFDSLERYVAEELKSQVKIMLAHPAGADIREFGAQTVDVVLDGMTYFCGKLDRYEEPPGLAHLLISIAHYFAGVITIVSFVAAATAALLKGSARGVTFRQSSS